MAMGFLSEPFKHDLFVSYSHGAFEGQHDSDLKRWSQKFARDLRAEFAGTTEFQNISVFLDQSERSDESVDRTAELPEHLQKRVQDSALLTILMTPHYLRSEWCRQEREWWCAKHNPDKLGAGTRIFVCRVRPTSNEPWPRELPAAVGYFLYDQNKEPDKARPFTWRGSKRDLDDYNDLLVDLAGDMMKPLREIRAALERRRQRDEAAGRLAAETGQVIYLHARETHAEAWQRASDLLAKNYVVVPTEPDPIAREPKAIREIAEHRVRTLSGSDALLLLGTDDGRALEADLVVVGRQDRHSARARTDRLLPCSVLDTTGGVIATARRKATARALGIDWIDAARDLWPNELKAWLNEASAVMERA
jgi:TIR domain